MQFNLTRHISVPLRPDQCLGFMEEQINTNTSFDFHSLWFFRPFSFIQGWSARKHKFHISAGPWARIFDIEGYIKPNGDNSTIFMKMMPPVWFYFLFAWGPMLIFLQLYFVNKEGIIVIALMWLLWSNFVAIANIKIALRIFAELDKVFEIAEATPEPPRKLPSKYYFKKALLYFIIATIYITTLFLMSRALSS
ncbi:MAG: hypothetical protein KAR47_21735 [Planctomycetes bacterium]|nr:hypothetical protein [Planctomycetota bacterium]